MALHSYRFSVLYDVPDWLNDGVWRVNNRLHLQKHTENWNRENRPKSRRTGIIGNSGVWRRLCVQEFAKIHQAWRGLENHLRQAKRSSLLCQPIQWHSYIKMWQISVFHQHPSASPMASWQTKRRKEPWEIHNRMVCIGLIDYPSVRFGNMVA